MQEGGGVWGGDRGQLAGQAGTSHTPKVADSLLSEIIFCCKYSVLSFGRYVKQFGGLTWTISIYISTNDVKEERGKRERKKKKTKKKNECACVCVTVTTVYIWLAQVIHHHSLLLFITSQKNTTHHYNQHNLHPPPAFYLLLVTNTSKMSKKKKNAFLLSLSTSLEENLFCLLSSVFNCLRGNYSGKKMQMVHDNNNFKKFKKQKNLTGEVLKNLSLKKKEEKNVPVWSDKELY